MDIKFAAIYIIIPTLLIVLAIMFKLTVNRNINKKILIISKSLDFTGSFAG